MNASFIARRIMTLAGGRNEYLSVPIARAVAPHFVAGLILLSFWAVSLHQLDVIPQVYEDEPWQASTAHKLATDGVFGSDQFAGFYRMDERYYGFLPLHPLLLALVFKFAGTGLFQARFEAVALGLLTLGLTFALGRRLFGLPVGLLAVLFLVLVRWTGTTASQLAGIPLLDLSRIARYDIAVPVFGISSLHAYVWARRRPARWGYVLAGLLAGLAGLAHLYGTFWLVALFVLAAWDDGRRFLRRPSGYLLVAGFVLVWLPYLGYVVTDLSDFHGQGQVYVAEGRFELLNPGWYWQNLRDEYRRYGPGLGPLDWRWLQRVGLWSAVVAVPLSHGVLAARAVRRRDEAARAIVVPLFVIALLFALLLRLKLVNYTLTLIPLAAVGAAWGVAQVWRRLSGPNAVGGDFGHRQLAVLGRLALVVVFVGIVIEGSTRIAVLENAAASTTPYGQFIGRVREHVPDHARILALHNYWFGLDGYEFRSFWVPLRWTDGVLVPDPVPFDVALDRIAPDVVMLDPRMRAFLDEALQPGASGHDVAVRFWTWMERRGARLAARIEDSTYGTMEVYRVDRPQVGYPSIPAGRES